jgi:hypothetical protein
MPTLVEHEEKESDRSPRFVNHPAYRCLRIGDVAGFHRYASEVEAVDLSDSDLRGVDLRKADPAEILMSLSHGTRIRTSGV